MSTGRSGPDTRPGKGGTDITVDMFVKTMKVMKTLLALKPIATRNQVTVLCSQKCTKVSWKCCARTCAEEALCAIMCADFMQSLNKQTLRMTHTELQKPKRMQEQCCACFAKTSMSRDLSTRLVQASVRLGIAFSMTSLTHGHTQKHSEEQLRMEMREIVSRAKKLGNRRFTVGVFFNVFSRLRQ